MEYKGWQRLEYGDSSVNPTLGKLLRIARALETDIAELTRGLVDE